MTNETIQGFSISPLQHHLWRTQGPESVGSRIALLRARVQGDLDADRLRDALLEVARSNEILRTVYPLLPGTHVPVQSILDEVRVAFEESTSPVEEVERRFASDPFDVKDGPLLRAALVRSGADTYFVLAQPTISADAVSLWNLVEKTCAVLRGEAPAAPTEEDEGPMQFADIAQWLHDHLESEDAEEGIAHWHAIGYGMGEIQLPLAFDRGEAVTGVGRHAEPFDAGARAALSAAAEQLGVAQSSVLFAAWSAFLARSSEQHDLIVGDLSLGRGFEGLDEALGPYGRFLPIAVHVDMGEDGTTLASLAKELDEARGLAGEHHEAFDFERAGAGGKTLLPVTFAMHAEVEPTKAGNATLTLEARSCDAEPPRIGLELDLGCADPKLVFAYAKRHLTEEDVAAMADSFVTFLAAALARPEASLAEHSMVSPAMRATLLERFALGPDTPAPGEPVHAAIFRIAAETPDAPAVGAPDGSLSYGELAERAHRIANHLIALGQGPGKFVGLHQGRSTDLVASILGTLEAGAAYLPLPPEYPAERIAFMLEDTGAEVVLSNRAHRSELPDSVRAQVICLDDCEELSAQPAEAPEPRGSLDDPAYVIFTSGSTGKPKGVPIPHRNLAHSTAARSDVYRHRVESFLLVSSFAFDSSVAGIFWTLSQGGKLMLPEDGFEQEIGQLAALFAEHGVTHTLGLPSLHKLVLESAENGQLDSLRTVIVAGESCPAELIRLHRERLPDTELYNEYGPTECTVWSTCFDCLEPFERRSVPIGRPIPRAQAYVVDAQGELAAIGCSGELLIAGAGVAPGYLGRPELTAERFTTLDLGDGTSPRVYRTGDRVRWLPSGNLEFLGRTDHQVKIRGYRIELEEIDAVLASHPDVREAVVMAREDTPGDLRLVAYAQPRAGAELDPAGLRDHLAGPLPDYMVPAHFVILPDLPLLPNGKVNRKELPAPDQATSLVRAAYVEPKTSLEKALSLIWSDVLGADRVGLDDDFFDLGGHSILATQLFARIVDLLQVRIQLRAIFDVRTLGGLANHMREEADDPALLEETASVILSALD